METPEGFDHLDQEFWARVEERDGCWIFASDSLSTPTYKGSSIFVYVSGERGAKSRICSHRKCVKPGHFVVGHSHRDERGNVPGPRRARRVRTQAQFDRWYSQC